MKKMPKVVPCFEAVEPRLMLTVVERSTQFGQTLAAATATQLTSSGQRRDSRQYLHNHEYGLSQVCRYRNGPDDRDHEPCQQPQTGQRAEHLQRKGRATAKHEDIQNVGIAETVTLGVTKGLSYYVEMSGCGGSEGSYTTNISTVAGLPANTCSEIANGDLGGEPSIRRRRSHSPAPARNRFLRAIFTKGNLDYVEFVAPVTGNMTVTMNPRSTALAWITSWISTMPAAS